MYNQRITLVKHFIFCTYIFIIKNVCIKRLKQSMRLVLIHTFLKMSFISETLETNRSTDQQSLEETFSRNLCNKKIWEELIIEKHDKLTIVNEYLLSKIDTDNSSPENPHLKYLNDNIFPLLLPLLEKTIFKAIRMECLKNQKSIFNGIDYISERLWLSNPRYPERSTSNKNIFLMDWVQEWLKDHPRLIFPKSWIWSKEEGAIVIQAYMRGHFVRKTEEVQEMRQFWKTLYREKKEKEFYESRKSDEEQK